MPIVSVIVPVFGAEKTIACCVNSLLCQRVKDVEIILVDDGSKDSSGAICDDLAQKDCRIIVIHKDNGGVSSARNAGLDKASGTWISFVDSDDWVEEGYLDPLLNVPLDIDFVQVGIIRDYPTGRSVVSDNANTIKQPIGELFTDKHWKSTSVSYFFKRGVIEDFSIRVPLGIKYSEDRQFIATYAMTQNDILFCKSAQYHYIIDPASASHSYRTRNQILNDLTVLRNIYSFAGTHLLNDKEEILKFLTEYQIDSYISILMMHMWHYNIKEFVILLEKEVETGAFPCMDNSFRKYLYGFIKHPYRILLYRYIRNRLSYIYRHFITREL